MATKNSGKFNKKASDAAKKNRATQNYREGRGRIKDTPGAKRSARGTRSKKIAGTQGEGHVAGSSGTRAVKNKKTGRTTRVVVEKGANKIKKRGVSKSPKAKANRGRLTKSKTTGKLQQTGRKKVKKVSAIKKKKKK